MIVGRVAARRASLAGLAYGGAIFGLGFVLGTVREVALAPFFGRGLVVAIEVPLILAAAWLVCRRLVESVRVAARPDARLLMGAVAFIVLMTGEAGVAVFGFGRSIGDHLGSYMSAGALLELLPQLLFALFPLLILAFSRRDDGVRT